MFEESVSMSVSTFVGSQGLLLIKKNCLSVELLPTPWSPLDIKPEMLQHKSRA